MAEIIGLLGSGAALIQLATYAHRFARALYDVAHDGGSAMEDMARFSDQVFTFSHAIEYAHLSLNQHCRKHQKSPAITYMLNHDIMAALKRESEAVQRQIKNATRRLTGKTRSKYTIITITRWMLQKNSISNLLPQMEHIKTTLILILSISMFEVMSWEVEDAGAEVLETDLKREIKQVKRAIKSHLNHLKRIEYGIERRGNSLLNPLDRKDSGISMDRGYEALSILSKSMIKTGNVPTGHRKGEKSDIAQAFVDSTAGTRQRDRRRTASKSAPSTSTHSPIPLRVDSRAASRTSSPPVTTSHKRDNSQKKLVVKANAKYENKPIDGYVMCPNGETKRVTAEIVRDMRANIISRTKVLELCLKLEPKERNEVVWLDFGNKGSNVSLGKAVLEWMQSDREVGHTPPTLTLICEVCGDCDRDIILGAPFLEKLQQQRDREES